MWIRWVELAIGGWLIAAPFVLGYEGVAYWNDILVGLLTVVLAILALSPRSFAYQWTGFTIGVWLLLAPFVLQYVETPAALWNDVICGVLLLGVASVVYSRRYREEHPADTVEGQ